MSKQVIDESVALQCCQQQRTLMLRIMASFYHQYATHLQPTSPPGALNAAQTQQLAHDLKSTAPSCGALTLAQLASQLAPPAPAPTDAEQRELLTALRDVLFEIERRYPEVLSAAANPQKDCLQELRQALEQHNLKSLTIFKHWAKEYAGDWPDSVIDAIQQALNSFDFKRARMLLETALADTNTDGSGGI